MSSINFYLVKPRQGASIIQLVVLHEGVRLTHSTSERVLDKHWDGKKQRIKPAGRNATALNAYLDRLERDAHAAILEAKTNKEKLTKPLLLRHVAPERSAPPEEPQLVELFDEFLKVKQETRMQGTWKVYRTVANSLAEMQRRDGRTYRVGDLGAAWLERYTSFMLSTGVNNVTLDKRLRLLRGFAGWLRLRGLDVPPDFDRYRHGLKTQGSDKMHLTLDEFRRLRDCVPAESALWSMLERNDAKPGPVTQARDVFVAGCLTGLRFSDLSGLRQELIIDGRMRLMEQKTGRTLRLDVHPHVLEMLERYGGALPVPANATLNRYIKVAARQAGVDAPVVDVEFKGGERVERVLPKWRLVTTHTARRTFIALGLELGVPVQVMQRMVGHATLRQTQAYLDVTEADVEAAIEKLRRL